MELIINYYAKRSRHTEVKKGIYNDALTLRNWFVDNLDKLLKKLTTASSRYFLYRVRSSIWQTCGEEDCAAGDCLSCLADDQNIVIAAAGRQLSQLLHQGGGGLQQHLLHIYRHNIKPERDQVQVFKFIKCPAILNVFVLQDY